MEHRSEGWEGTLGDPQCEEVSDSADGHPQMFHQGHWKCRGGQSLEQMPLAGLGEAGHRVLRMPRALVEAQSTPAGCKTIPKAFGHTCYRSWHEVPM